MNIKIFKLDNGYGVPIVCRLVEEGDRYGADDCMVNKKETMLEFYDERYEIDYNFRGTSQEAKAAGAECLGQFISRYFISTLTRDLEDMTHGLSLHGGTPEWVISKGQLKKALEEARMRVGFDQNFSLRVAELSAYMAESIASCTDTSEVFYQWATNVGRGFPAMHCQVAVAAIAGEKRFGAEWFIGSREYIEDAFLASSLLVGLRIKSPDATDEVIAEQLWDAVMAEDEEDET